ncbi:tetratricopeptide repeat protein [cf. Phormidesmis sp. LEGE 11477]|uniref:J domain-containing protein n=1 Tax=cf. Phormidesmis sp. LEGE 11477 TaxID=1828680 RepID=UPI00187F9FC3|nr:tetratricopeptide repeat protein [cf. Phormidesmis sp. LEGE 11477]MBE9059457.1 tetratricopeptide repeat protein [cf. Phormidesmis sp. LEGE 11477]
MGGTGDRIATFFMPAAELFTELTNLVDVDPFALIGISVSADEKRIAKRYRSIAKQLHPDILANLPNQQGLTSALAAQVIARIVNPSYQKLKHEKSRKETLTMLRLRVRRLSRSDKLIPTFEHAQKLAAIEDSGIDVYYEQAVSQLAQTQFATLDRLHAHSLELGQLNLIYLSRKMTAPAIRKKRSGLISSPIIPTAGNTVGSTDPISASSQSESRGENSSASIPAPPAPPVNYVARHTERAKTYLKQRNYEYAVQELREALKLSPQSPEIHSMLAQTYYKQSLIGMAKAHFKQAYRLNPNHSVVKKYIELLGLSAELEKETAQRKPPSAVSKIATDSDEDTTSTTSKTAWLGKLLRR